MSKAAGQALMRHVAVRFGEQGIRANTLAPALTLHSRIENLVPPSMTDMAKAAAALKSRVGRPDDLAAMGALLMSDDGSYITGQVISIDGGTTMRP
jgi:NAD(P)-dependent dehydrogenase (short-subunit alcohol dehydrogenase family)